MFHMPVTYSQLREFSKENSKRIRIGHINDNSIRKEEDRPLNVLRQDYLDKLKLDILCIQETKIDDSTFDQELSNIGYRTFREGKKKHGGLLIFARKNLPISSIPCLVDNKPFKAIECIVLHVCSADYHFVLISLYRRPSISLSLARDEVVFVLNVTSSIESDVIVIGDLNLCALGRHKKPQSELLNDICDQFNMNCMVSEVTRPASGSCLDIVLADENIVADVVVHDPGLSDHCMVIAALNCMCPTNEKRSFRCRSFKNFDPENFLSDINDALPVFGVSCVRCF